MNAYRHILLAVDLDERSGRVADRAMDVAGRYGARISLMHVVEYIPVDPAGEALLPTPVNAERELMETARERLEGLAERLGVPAERCHVTTGSVKRELCRQAKESGVDLIILGRHERHGLALLLGSTEDAIIHAAPCDVLAVDLDSQEKD